MIHPPSRDPSGALSWYLPYQDDDLVGFRGDTVRLMYEPYLPPGSRWSGQIEYDQCVKHDLGPEEIALVRAMWGIEEEPRP